MYPPSMLSSAALAAAAHSLCGGGEGGEGGEGQLCGREGQLDLGLLVNKLQLLTRVENVSFFI